MEINHINDVQQNLIRKIEIAHKELLLRFPVETYVHELSRYPRIESYKFVSKPVENWCRSIIGKFGENAMALYHQLLLVSLIRQSVGKMQDQKIPESVKAWYRLTFDLILEKIETDRIPLKSFLYPEDRLFKDLGVCSMRLIPAGVRKVHIEKLPLKLFMFRGGVKQIFLGLKLVFFDIKGIGPFYHGHLDSRDRNSIAQFNKKGWIEHYRIMAELLRANPDIKGVQGLAWFYDPHLKNISPELSYLSEIITQNGGKIFYVDHSANATKNAIKLSSKRKRLYEEGKYSPANYFAVWPRKRIMRWAANMTDQTR